MSAADVPLVGRGSELHDITSAFASSPCAAVVVAGPAGVGKSRLTADATAAIASGSRQVMHVIGSQAGAAIPFGAFVQLLPDAAPAAGTTLQLLQILSKAIAAYAHNGVPMLLLIEDAHLLDAGSAALVHQLVRSQACGVVASIRTPDVAPDPIVALWKDGLAQRIDLKPLNRAECDALAASYLGGVVASASLQWLWKTSAGNPLFMRELLVGARDSGSVYNQNGIWFLRLPLPAPARLTDLIRARLATIAPTTAEVVDLLAIGEPLGVGDLVAIAGTEPLEDAENRGLIVVNEDRNRAEVRLAHPLYGELLRSQIAPVRARRLSHVLVDAFERAGARRRDDVMRIARWRLDAGAVGNPDLLEQAARQARSVRDFALAARLARAALAGGGGVTAGLVLAETEFAAGRHREAEVVLAWLAPTCVNDEERALIANARVYNLGILMGDEAAAAAVLAEALATIHDPAARELLLARQTISHLYSGRLSAALIDTDELLVSSDSNVRRRGAYARAVAMALLGQTGDAVATAYDALDEHRRSLEARGATSLADFQPPEGQLVGAVIGHLLGGRLMSAERDARLAYDVGLERRDEELQATFCLLLGWVLVERGLLGQAANLFREGAAINRELTDLATLRWCLAGIALAEAMAGEAMRAQEAIAELDALQPHWMVAFDLVLIERSRAWLLIASGQRTAARSLLLAAAEAARVSEQLPVEAVLLHDLVRLDEAKTVLPRLVALQELVDGDFVPAYAAHADARVLRDGAGLEEVSGRFEQLGAILLATEAAAAATEAHGESGNERRAHAQARERARLQALSEAAHSPLLVTTEAAVPLTRRELEIALLAGAGLSSKVVAERLVVSVRTVDNHLQHVYAKLGVTNRAELEQTLRALGLSHGR
jgi:DNA-binding NarL/FixJ family response regulator